MSMAARAGLDVETIVRKAAELADKDGLNALSMATLAAYLGVRSPALYHYFDGLAGLRRQLSLLGLREGETRVGRAVMGKSGDDAVLALARALWDFASEHPGLYEAASRAPDPNDAEWQAAGREVVDDMVRALSAYRLSDDAARQVVRMVRSIVHGCISLEHLGGFGISSEPEATLRHLLAALLDYLHTHLEGT